MRAFSLAADRSGFRRALRGIAAGISGAVLAAALAVVQAGVATAEERCVNVHGPDGLTYTCLSPGTPPAGPVVQNGSFEEPSLVPGGSAMSSSLPGWSVPSGQLIEVRNIAPGGAGRAGEGTQLVEIDSKSSTSLTQTVATMPDTTYALRISYSARPGVHPGENRVDVYWDGKLVTHLTADGSSATTTEWNRYTATVKSTHAGTALTLKDVGPSNGIGMYVDHVSVEPLTCRLTRSGAWDDASNWVCYLPASKAIALDVPGIGNPVEVEIGKTVVMGLHSSGLKPGAPGVTLYRGAGVLVSTLGHQDIVDSAAAMVANRPALPASDTPSSFVTQAQLVDLAIGVSDALQEAKREIAEARMQRMQEARDQQEQTLEEEKATYIATWVVAAAVVVAGPVLLVTVAPVAMVAAASLVLGFTAGAWAAA